MKPGEMISVQLIEKTSPPEMGNTLIVEKSLDPDKALFICICPTGDDPSKDGLEMMLDREQVRTLMHALAEAVTAVSEDGKQR